MDKPAAAGITLSPIPAVNLSLTVRAGCGCGRRFRLSGDNPLRRPAPRPSFHRARRAGYNDSVDNRPSGTDGAAAASRDTARDCRPDSNLRVESSSLSEELRPWGKDSRETRLRHRPPDRPFALAADPRLLARSRYGIDGSYEAIDVAPGRRCRRSSTRLQRGEFVGGNVTIPHKEAGLRAVRRARSAGRDDRRGQHAGRPAGRRLSASTPTISAFSAISTRTRRAGTRGSTRSSCSGQAAPARAVLVALKSRGVQRIHLLNRTLDKAEDLALDLEGPILAGGSASSPSTRPRAGLVVNTTSVGMQGTRFDDARSRARCPRPRSSPTSSMCRSITPLLADAAGARPAGPSTASACCCTRRCPASRPGSAVRPEVTPELRALVEATL